MNAIDKAQITEAINLLTDDEDKIERLVTAIERDIENIEAILVAPGTEEERREAVVYGISAIIEKFEITGLIPELGPLRDFVAEQFVTALIPTLEVR